MKIIKQIEVGGLILPVDAVIEVETPEDLANSKLIITVGTPIAYLSKVDTNRYDKTTIEFLDEVCQKNSVYKTYKAYLDAQS